MNEQLAFLAIFVFLFSLVSGRVSRSFISGPMIFVATGLLMGPSGLGWFSGEEFRDSLHWLADFTLALFLFTDAANANLTTLKKASGIPARLLLIGLPGSIALGFTAAFYLFDVLTLFEAAMLGTMLAATDAALGKAVVTNKSVPGRIREGLNVESGLNDGLCVPVLFVFVALEVGGERGLGEGLIAELLARELGLGVLIGITTAAIGAWFWGFFGRLRWTSGVWSQITPAALAISCFAIAQTFHASGYIAAFSGGLLFGYLSRGHAEEVVFAAEGIAETMALLTWFLFGFAVVGRSFSLFSWPVLAYALLSLTLIRMLPVFLALMGSGEKAGAKLFIGWFGPRGLASIVFSIIVLEKGLPGAEFMALVVTSTVLSSLVLHGVSAKLLAEWIGRQDR
ncbi:MAG TPA: cation:proton antiporter [Xanthomonadales bacterium]|nr:cation:proton antiporter [Xanthomonadales bacterium]